MRQANNKKTFGRPHRNYKDRKKICDEIHKKFTELIKDPEFNQRHVISSLAIEYRIPRSTMANWARHWKSDINWRPYDMDAHGSFHRIFSDEQERSIAKYIKDNYIEPGNYFSDQNFQMICFDFYDDFFPISGPKFECSPHFIQNFKARNRISSRRAHFKKRPDIDFNQDENQNKIDKFKAKVSSLIEDARRNDEIILNADETSLNILPTNLMTWARKGSDHVVINVKNDEKERITAMATISVDDTKIPLYLIAKGNSEDSIFDQLGEDFTTENATFSSKAYMTTECFCNYLEFLRSHIPNKTIHLILDGYASHKSRKSQAKAEELNIKLIYIPDGYTDILQPLDVAVFSVLKSIAKSKIRKFLFENNSIDINTSVSFFLQSWNEISIDVFNKAWELYF